MALSITELRALVVTLGGIADAAARHCDDLQAMSTNLVADPKTPGDQIVARVRAARATGALLDPTSPPAYPHADRDWTTLVAP